MTDSTTPPRSIDSWRDVIGKQPSFRASAIQMLADLTAYGAGAPARDIDTLANALAAIVAEFTPPR